MPGVCLMLVGMSLLFSCFHPLISLRRRPLHLAHYSEKHQPALTHRRAVEVTLEFTSPHSVTPKEMMAVLNLMSSSPVAMFVKNCSTQQKVMLASVVRCVRREGIAEIPWRNVSLLLFHLDRCPIFTLLFSHLTSLYRETPQRIQG